MEWYNEVAVILIPALITFHYFRKYVKPLERIMTWLVFLFASIPLVQMVNQFIKANGILPEAWGHLPMQALVTVLLVLFMPVRQETKKDKAEVDKDGSTTVSDVNSNRKASSRRFKKKSGR